VLLDESSNQYNEADADLKTIDTPESASSSGASLYRTPDPFEVSEFHKFGAILFAVSSFIRSTLTGCMIATCGSRLLISAQCILPELHRRLF